MEVVRGVVRRVVRGVVRRVVRGAGVSLFYFPYYDKIEGTLDDMSDPETKAQFRLTSSEFPRLAEALRIPEMFTCCNEIGRLVNHA